ncbi:SRPBCC family protein [Arthrobacter sp. M4]|uniref:SRPBCC family protein n=1 Tax=Arthrobacter sp. M4 TaxID=218160 RepID=UPI001CDBA053|nr:SRPBCC family protein [Arthrobacter sp. M4]MCA4134574.1 SRPBCC family protein [Arthrobacter sp. M4]
MTTTIEKRVLVDVPVKTAYNQWTQFEDFPHFMGGVESVRQLSDDRLHWVAEIAGMKRSWDARIVEQLPDRKIAWEATEGARNAGSVLFEDAGNGQTAIQLVLEYDPEGLLENAADKLHLIENQAEADLKRFKEFIEDEGYETGAWRGTIQGGSVTSGVGGDTLGSETTASDAAGQKPDRIGRPFDQTNELADFEGDSDETAASDTQSAAEREAESKPSPAPGIIPPVPPTGGSLGQH